MKKISLVLLLGCTTSMLGGCNLLDTFFKEEVDEDVAHYATRLNELIENNDTHSLLYVFPKDISNYEIKNFKYKKADGLFDGSYLLYLRATMPTEEVYNSEITRLDSLEAVFSNGESKKPYHMEEGHYFMTIHSYNTEEYMKYSDEDLTISYVFSQFYEIKDEIPKADQVDFSILPELPDWDGTYHMYYYYIDNVGYFVDEKIPK